LTIAHIQFPYSGPAYDQPRFISNIAQKIAVVEIYVNTSMRWGGIYEQFPKSGKSPKEVSNENKRKIIHQNMAYFMSAHKGLTRI